MSTVDEFITSEEVEKYINSETERFLRFLLQRIHNVLNSYISGAVHLVESRYRVALNIDSNVVFSGTEIQMMLRVYIDPTSVVKVRESIRKLLQERYSVSRLRLKALYRLIRDEYLMNTGELNAVLSSVCPTTSEGDDKAGGDREEVRGKEGRPTTEGSDEGNV